MKVYKCVLTTLLYFVAIFAISTCAFWSAACVTNEYIFVILTDVSGICLLVSCVTWGVMFDMRKEED